MARRQRTRAVAAGTAVSVAALCAAWVPALGQEGDGGLLFTLGLSTTLSASDNADLDPVSAGDTFLSETTLSFGLESITRTQALRFSLSDTFRTGDGPGAPATAGFRGTNADLSYERFVANSRFNLSARLNTRDLNADVSDEDIEDSDDLIVDNGTLTTTRLGFGLETGLEAPFGTELSLSQFRRKYSGTTDPDLEDSRRLTGNVALIFRPDPMTETRLAYTHTEYVAEDVQGTERTTRSLAVSARRQLDPNTAITGSLGWTEITETWTAVPLTLPADSGFTASLGYSRGLPAGNFSAELSRDVTSAGGRTDISATRAFEFPAGTVEITLGATKPDASSLQPTGRIALSRALPDQRFSVALSSNISVNSDSV
ncbi:MAG: hypothetical protein LJE68_05155, partial [Rhodobacter sp.]|nr:hypothetical protein [Rhodobacter sp.]